MPNTPLGHHVRGWLKITQQTSESLNRRDMSERDRSYGNALGWFTAALRGVLNHDPRAAALAAVRPLTSGIAVITDAGIRESVIDQLGRSGTTP